MERGKGQRRQRGRPSSQGAVMSRAYGPAPSSSSKRGGKERFKAYVFLCFWNCAKASFAQQTTTEPQVRCAILTPGQQQGGPQPACEELTRAGHLQSRRLNAAVSTI